jgi:hypothetical protein
MFPDLEHHPMQYVLHVCGLRDIPSQTQLMEFEGLEIIEDLAHYTDSELDTMAFVTLSAHLQRLASRWDWLIPRN